MQEWQSNYNFGIKSLGEGNPKLARTYLLQVIQSIELEKASIPFDFELSLFLNYGLANLQLSQPDEATNSLNRVIELAETNALHIDNPNYLRACIELGNLNKFNQELDTALLYFSKIFNSVKKIDDKTYGFYCWGKFYFSGILSQKGNLADSENGYKDVINQVKILGKTNEIIYGSALNNLGHLYRNSARHNEAEKAFLMSCHCLKQLCNNHPSNLNVVEEYCTSLLNLSELYFALEKFRDCIPLLKISLAILKPLENYGAIKSLLTTYNLLANVYCKLRQFKSAKDQFDNAIELSENANGESEIAAAIWYNSGTVENELGNWILARDRVLKSLSIGKVNGNSYMQIDALAQIYQRLGEITEAEKIINTGLSELENAGLAISYPNAQLLNRLGTLQSSQGNYLEAASTYEKAAKILEKEKFDPDFLLTVKLNQVSDLALADKITEADKIFESIHEELSSKIKNKEKLENGCGNLISTYYKQKGDFLNANKWLDWEIKTLQEVYPVEDVSFANVYFAKGELYLQKGDYEQAEEHLRKARDLFEHMKGKNDFYMTIQLSYSSALYYQGNQESATCILNQIIKYFENKPLSKNNHTYKRALLSLGHILINADHINMGLEHIQKAESFIDSKDRLTTWGENGVLGCTFLANGEIDKAKRYLEASYNIAIRNKIKENFTLFKVMSSLVDLYQRLEKSEELLKIIDDFTKQISRWIESYLFAGNFEAIDSWFKTLNLTLVDLFASLPFIFNLNQDIGWDILRIRITTKGFKFKVEKLIRYFISELKSSKIHDQYQRYFEISRKITALDRLSVDPDYEGGEELKKFLLAKKSIEKSLFRNMPSGLVQSAFQLSLDDIRRNLLDDSVYIEVIRTYSRPKDDGFFYLDRSVRNIFSYLFVIVYPANHTKRYSLLNWSDVDESMILLKLKEDESIDSETQIELEQKFDAEIYKKFWKPIRNLLKEKKKILFSPDGIFLDFHIGSIADPFTSDNMLDLFHIHYISTSANQQRKNTLMKGENCQLFGAPDYNDLFSYKDKITAPDYLRNSFSRKIDTDPQWTSFLNRIPKKLTDLPSTEKEVLEIGKLFEKTGMNASIFLGKNASENNIQQSPSPKILHFATHGFFDEKKEHGFTDLILDFKAFNVRNRYRHRINPFLRVGIYLSGACKDYHIYLKNFPHLIGQGIFTSQDVLNLDLIETELVVLSACTTGKGTYNDEGHSEGFVSALFAVGVKFVLISTREIDDEITMEFMVQFYKLFLNGKGIHESFHLSQCLLKNRYPDQDDYGSFILYEGVL